MDLTKRQRVLLGRLEVLAERLATWTLPVRDVEVWGFGSFFRLKGSPRDVDLMLVFGEWSPEFERFDDAVAQIRRLRTRELPKEAVLRLAPQLGDALAAVYSHWLTPYTWSLLSSPMAEIFSFGAEVVTRRILAAGLPKLSIHTTKRGHDPLPKERASFLVWRPDRPDIHENLLPIFAPTQVRATLLQELANFEGQLVELRQQVQVQTGIFRAALRERRRGFDDIAWTRATTDIVIAEVAAANGAGAQRSPRDPARTALADDVLAPLVEQKRAEVKEVQAALAVAEAATSAATAYAIRRPPYPKPDWVALAAFVRVRRHRLKPDAIRRALAGLGLPGGRVMESRPRLGRRCYEVMDGHGRIVLGETDLWRG